MPLDFSNLKGLKASDRTDEEQKAIDDVMGYKSKPVQTDLNIAPSYDSASAAALDTYLGYQQHLAEQYQNALAEREEALGVGRTSVNANANDYLDQIANNASSYYKKFKGTDKLPLDDEEKKQLAAAYDARKKVYGEQSADVWLDNYMKDKVGQNQTWWEQAVNGVSHLIPAIEGGAIQAIGNLYGAVNHILGNGKNNEDLNWWDSFIDDIIDNPVTRYGRDVEMSGASNVAQGAMNLLGLSDETAADRIETMKQTATKYNPEGIGNDAIVTTSDQDESFFNSTTPWQALQSGGFTALSMLVGAGEAKAAGWLFGKAAKGMNWLNSTNRAFKTAEALEKGLVGLKRAQNFTDIAVIPGAVGTMEGAMEGLNTKIEVERDAVEKLDEYYRDKVSKEADAIINSDELNPMIALGDGTARRMLDPNAVFQEVWDKYKDEYTEARRQIDWASSKAGIHNFYANSLINGMMNTTLKAGLMAPRVQETLRNSKLTGWAYRNPRFNYNEATGEVTSRMSKLGAVKQVLKEPFGEGMEEYLQSLSNDVFSGAAENNIDEFIKNKFEGDGTAKVTDSFGSDYAAALTAMQGSLTNKESIESAILGAVSSTMGTVGGIGRGYHRDANGNLVQNSLFDPRNLARSLNSAGEQESMTDYLRRVTPWRSGLINAYFDRRQEEKDANETAATMTEWLKDPQNKAKWDGLTGTANWITQMENAAESNDQFSYRKAQMGKAINDVFMLSKLEGTDYYDSVIADLQKAASGEITQEDIQKLRQNGGADYQGVSDQEIVEKVQSNANKMLGLMTQVEQEGRQLDRLLGRVDEDTKQSLIFGKIMEQDFAERRDQLQEEIDTIKNRIQNSRNSANIDIPDNVKSLILKYGSIKKALHADATLQNKKGKLKERIDELEAIDPTKTSDKQKEELIRSKKELNAIDKELKSFEGLNNEEGKIDSSWVQLVLNEQDIMDLDPVTRAMVLAQGANKLYNATHQNRQRVDQLNIEIDDINHQIDALEAQKQQWTKADGGIKKGHNKQYQRNNQKIAELQKQKESKMRQLDAEQGKQDSKPIYNSAQQAVIDNLVQQGMAQDADFLDKVVDMGRLEKGIKDYHTQYQAILSDPRAFHNYVQRAKYNAQRDLTRRRAERIAGIQNYQEYAQELDRLTANASQQEMNEIMQTLRAEDTKQKKQYQQDNMVVDPETGELVAGAAPQTNYDRYMANIKQQGDLVRQFAKNPNLTDNDQSLLLDAMQYLSANGIDMTDRDAAVQALIEKDEQGNVGGKFRKFVEAKNDMMPEQQRAFMPVFTSIGQVVGQYVDLLNGATEDAINRGNLQPTVVATPQPTGQPVQPTVVPSPSPSAPAPAQPATSQQPEPAPAGPTLFNIGGATPEAGHFVDGDGTVATGSQTQAMQERQAQPESVAKSATQQLFEQVTTPEIARMVDAASNIIETSNISDEAKALARQYLEQIAVNNNERLETIDDVLTALQEQISRLTEVANQQEEDNNNYRQAAGLLQKVYGSLNAKKLRGRGRTRTAPMPTSRPADTRANWIMTANIYYIQQKNPDAWAVRFTEDHDIEAKTAELKESGAITATTPIYFITDDVWTGEVTRQMQPTAEMLSINPNARKYDRLTDLPVVAAVRVETPLNPANTTAIEVGGLWYQPIGIMPSTKSRNQGSERTFDIRSKATQEQGRHLITENGLPNGAPLTTRVFGANWLSAHHPDASGESARQNIVENNTEMQEFIFKLLPIESVDRLRALPKEQMLEDPEYREARNKILSGMSWNEQYNVPAYTPSNLKDGETGNPMLMFTKPMAETTGRTDNRTLPVVLAEGTNDEVRAFNSRTQRLYDEVIRPIFQYIPYNPMSKSGDSSDKSAKVITKEDIEANAGTDLYQEEADRLTKLLNGFDGSAETKGIKGVSDFVYIKPGQGWSFKVTAPEALQVAGDIQTSQTVFKVFFINQDSSVAPIELGIIKAGQNDTDAAFDLMRNILRDAQTGEIRDFLNWQIPQSDAQNINNPKESKARQNYAALLDDGILTVAGSSPVYDIDGVKLRAPISTDGRILYPSDTVVNPTNATPAAPQNITPQGDGAIVTGKGQSVDPNSGASLDSSNPPSTPQESEKLKTAKSVTARIVADSKEFSLSKDETYYYIIDKSTGKEHKYLRVTTVIGADSSMPELTESQAKRLNKKEYVWTPELRDIYERLRVRHSLPELSDAQLVIFTSIDKMSKDLNIPVKEIRRVVAELRTEHKQQKYGAWGTPSTSVGNTADTITRDFLAGHLKDSYPNITKEALDKFVHQLELFKADLDSKGIHIVSEGVMAHGSISMTDSEGNTHDVDVAGTLDLFGYDDEGNFYIFDMKTTRDHSAGKLEKEKAKWSRQISMYADLLKQKYAEYGFTIDANNLRIIPINVDYPTPMGSRNDYLDPAGPEYSEIKTGSKKGQLQMKYRGSKKSNIGPETKMDIWAGTNPTNKELSNIAYRPFTLQLFEGEEPIQFNSVEHAFQYTKFRLLAQFLGFEETKPFLLSDQKLTGEDYKSNLTGYRHWVARGVKAASLKQGKGGSGVTAQLSGDYAEEEKYIKDHIEKLLNARDGWAAKRLGGRNGGYEIAGNSGSTFLDTIWSAGELVSEDVMKAAMKASFEQNQNALDILLRTGNATLTHNKGGEWKEAMPRLLMEVRDELGGWVDFNDSNLAMRTTDTNKQFQPGYTPFNINWDNLSSEDQDIADALATQTGDTSISNEQAPAIAQIETPKPQRPSFIAADAFFNDYASDTQDAAPQAPPITPIGTTPLLPTWRNLTNGQKQLLSDSYGIDNFEDYNELLNDPATAEGIYQDLRCKGLI